MPTRFTGNVIQGKKEARSLGYPTANIFYEGKDSGTYAGYLLFAQSKYPAALYFDPKRKILEAHILDHDVDLAGKEVTIEILEKIAEKESYPDVLSMQEGVLGIIEEVRKYFAEDEKS